MSGYYAGDGRIGSEPFDGAVEITAEQYGDALAAMMDGKIVKASGGFAIIDPPSPEPEPEPEPEPVNLTDYAANKRWQVETGGITINGVTIDTSRDSQAMITGAYAWSQANPSQPIQFKASSGWVEFDAATMAAIATAVGAHVQACFAAEASVQAAILGGTITTIAEIDGADWPG
ncbi:MAG: hypothetical protein ABS35_37735 [Kaistia sp. SCN 65-12]|nr:MAG: hypothetical protein ABS35_37735 [Kaistia sp. SCN 65-12]